LPDSIFVQIATEAIDTQDRIEDLPTLNGRLTRRNKKLWVGAVNEALSLADDELPATRVRSTTPPPPRTWQDKNPVAFARLEQVRAAIAALGESLNMPVENLITPDTVRRILWTPPIDDEQLAEMLNTYNARPWQQEIILPILRKALFESPISTELESVTEQ